MTEHERRNIRKLEVEQRKKDKKLAEKAAAVAKKGVRKSTAKVKAVALRAWCSKASSSVLDLEDSQRGKTPTSITESTVPSSSA
jgi:hypothetical protein